MRRVDFLIVGGSAARRRSCAAMARLADLLI